MYSAKNNFTLIELLTVIAIIALLAGMLFPALHKARASSYSVKCKNNLRSLGEAINMYTVDWDGYMPTANAMPSDPSLVDGTPPISEALSSYISTKNVGPYQCPADNGSLPRNNSYGETRPYYASEGSSYEYQIRLNGVKITDVRQSRRSGGESSVILMFDYDNFHGKPPKGIQFLFADGHVE